MNGQRSQLERLARPFAAKYIKQAPGGHGTYVDHEIINQALLLIVGPFSFEIRQIITNDEGLVEGCTAALTCTIDGTTVTVTEAGDCDQPKNSRTQGDRLKKAASDALKRCAMRLGCGIHLWAQADFFLYEQLKSQPESPGEGSPAERGADPSPLVSPAISQLATADA